MEMDLWEANNAVTAWTPHSCGIQSPHTGAAHTNQCDQGGCGFNNYAIGAETFYEKGETFAVDTSKPFTVVTQFISSDGTDTGKLVEIRRKYVQDGKVYPKECVASACRPLAEESPDIKWT